MKHVFVSGIPIYTQLKQILRSQIDSGIWPPGHMLPTEVEIAHQYGLSRTTVRQAILDLVREGLLFRRRGHGTVVAEPKMEANWASLSNLTSGLLGEDLERVHQSLDQRIIAADRSLARSLQVPEGSSVIEIVRLRLVKGDPVILETFHIPHDLAPGLEQEDTSNHFIYPLLEHRFGVHVRRAVTWLEPTILDELDAEYLAVSRHTPAILVRRLVWGNERPLASTKMVIRGDRCKYVMRWEEQQKERDPLS